MATTKYPYFIRTTAILLGLSLIVFALAQLGDILVPLSFAAMLAILLNPLANWMMGKKVPRALSIFLCLLVAAIVFGSISYFVITQTASFTTEMPVLKKKGLELLANLQQFIDRKVGIPMEKQNTWLAEAQNSLKPLAGSAISGMFGVLSMLFLLPVYTFLILYYKTLLINFIYEIFADQDTKEVHEVLSETKGAIQNYMSGLLIEALIVAAMNSAALLLIGVKYAILIGVLGALLNMLPYIGGLVAIAMPVIIATITSNGFQMQLWVIVAYLIIQFIDNNFLIPYIVSSRVKINALISIVIVLMGGALWGISGMFLSIPFIGLLKIIFDRIPELKPWGKLLGDQIPTHHLGQRFRKKAKQTA
jgi:predicted PurR-regulated permease PerM